MHRHLKLSFVLLALPAAAIAADITAPSSITGNVVWTRDNVYHLDGKVWIESGATLTIEAGTVVKGLPKADPALASALIATRGGKLFAMGTANAPIIFTAEADTLNGNLTQADRGLWGGLVLLGNGQVNTTSGQGSLEGLPAGDPRSVYGGGATPDDNDSSGELHFVSIRHCGAVVATNVELNGLSMGGVGRGTIIDYVEVYACNDDGYEWWGGAVECKHLVSAFNDDDNFDWDEGFHGKGQFWFAVQDPTVGNQAMEMDGGTTPENGTPFSIPTLYNVTVIGSGAAGANTNNQGLIFRDNSGGKIYNGIFTDSRGYAARIETESAQGAGNDSAARLAAGDLAIQHTIFGTFGAGTTDDQLFRAINVTGNVTITPNYVADYLKAPAQNNRINVDPLLRGISRARDAGLDPRPQATSPAFTGAATPPNDGFFDTAAYVGAFDNFSWLGGWTALYRLGYLNPTQFASGINQEFTNVSTRCFVGTGAQVAIPGFIIQGTEPKRVLIRAVGKRLESAPFNVPGVLQDATLEVYAADQTLLFSNDNWGDNFNQQEIQDVSVALSLGLYPIDPSDAAVLVTLPPGSFTVQVRGKNGGTGIAIVEVYGAD